MKHLGSISTGQDIATQAQLPAGGGAVATQVLLNVPSVVRGYAEVVVIDATVTNTSKVMVQLVGERDAENDIEELADSAMQVFAIPEPGHVRFVLTGNGRFAGYFKTNYQVLT